MTSSGVHAVAVQAGETPNGPDWLQRSTSKVQKTLVLLICSVLDPSWISGCAHSQSASLNTKRSEPRGNSEPRALISARIKDTASVEGRNPCGYFTAEWKPHSCKGRIWFSGKAVFSWLLSTPQLSENQEALTVEVTSSYCYKSRCIMGRSF